MIFNPQKVFSKQPMVFIAIGLIVGILFGELLDISIFPSVVSLFLLIILIYTRQWKYSIFLAVLLMIAVGSSSIGRHNKDFKNSLKGIEQYSNKKIQFSGIVTEINNYSSGQRFILNNVKLNVDDSNYTENIKYIVYPKDETLSNVSVGDTLISSGKYQLFSDIRNPGEYDFKRYYYLKHISGRIYSNSSIQVHQNPNLNTKKLINNFRESVRSKLTAYSDNDTAALLSALILGDRTKIDQDLRESFANVGVIHVLAVSGLHVGYVLVILMLLAKIFRIKWGWDKLFIIIGLMVFVILSGGRPSVVRASIMAGLYILAPVLNRRPSPWNIIATAAFIILMINPNSLYDLGFQLSFSAVLSIIYFYNLFNKFLPEKLRPTNIQNRTLRFFWSLFLVTISAQIGTIPITAFYFGRIPLIAIFANLIIIPLIGGFVALGFAKLLLFWIPPLSFFIDQVNWLIKELIFMSISVFDMFPYASISTPQFNWINLVQYILLIILLFLLLKRNYSKLIIFGVLLFNVMLWPWVFENKGTDIVFLDLGSNESTIIRTSNNKNILINTGVISMFADDVNRKVKPAANYLNIDRFNWYIRSKGNSNHQVASVKAVESIQIDTVWNVGKDTNSGFESQFMSIVKLKNINHNNIKRGDIIRIDERSYIQFLLPLNDNQIETSSLAFKFINGINSILFLDRLTDEEYEILIDYGDILKTDILKMSYPKQLPNNFNDFVNIVQPTITVITGARTSKNSPTYDELHELIESELFITDSLGATWLFSDGKNNIEVMDWK